MRVATLLFATYRDLAGSAVVEVDIPEGATAAELVAAVRELGGGLERLPPHAAVAINHTYASPDARIALGDEVALIPPVAGG